MQLTGISLAITNILGGRLNPLSWFGAGEQGAWYDPSDITTLFQDSAGNTPVTAVEQPVGLMLDKSGRNNHASQSTAGKRPILSARVNLLTKTEDFSNPAWDKVGISSAQYNSVIAPSGTQTASLIIGTNAVTCYVWETATVTASTTYSFSIYIKQASSSTQAIKIYDSAVSVQMVSTEVTWTAGVPTIVNNSGATTLFTPIDAGNGWYKVGFSFSTSTYTAIACLVYPDGINTGASSILWGADLRPTNAGALLPPYQRVNTSTDYDTVGFPLYLKCNGTSSAMSTNSIDFSGTDKMTVVTGVRKLSDLTCIALELSPVANSNTGSFYISAPETNGNYGVRLSGTSTNGYNLGDYVAPITNIISNKFNISGGSLAACVQTRINSSIPPGVVPFGTTAGTGNFGNYPLYLFARGGASFFFNGQFYGAIIRGAQSDTASVTQTENYMAQKTGITF